MNINFMLSGGGMPPFTYYLPVAINTLQPQLVASQTSSSSDATEKNKLTDKDLLEMLGKIDGLPNDMNLVYDMMSTFFSEKELGLSFTSLSTAYLRALQQLKVAKFNKELFDAAFKSALKNNSLSEIAITDSGQVVVTDGSEKFKFISPEEFLNNSDKYRPYTNLELLLMRLRDPDMAYLNGVFNFVNSAISSTKLGLMLDDFMFKLGTKETSFEGYSKIKANQVEEGINYLQNAANLALLQGMSNDITIDGLYKSKMLTKSQAQSAERALQHIYTTLPENAKTLIKLKTDGTKKGVIQYLTNYVLGLTEQVILFENEMVEDAEGKKPGTKEGSGSGGSGTVMSPAMAALLGKSYKTEVELNLGNSMSFKSDAYVSTIGKEGETGGALPAGSSLTDLSSSNFKGILDMNSATFGGSLLNDLGLRYSSLKDSDITFLELPIDYNAPNGIIRPNLELGKNIEKADDEIRLLGIKDNDILKINEIYLKHGLQPKYVGLDKDGNPVLNKNVYVRFAMVYANIDGKVLNEDTFNPELVETVTDDQSIEWFENIIKGKTQEKNYSIDTGFLGIGGDKLYRGAVFIPVRDNLFNAAMASGSSSQFKLPTNQVEEIYNRQELSKILNQTFQRYNKAPSLSILE